MRHPITIAHAEPVGLLGVTAVTLVQIEPHVAELCVFAPRAITFDRTTPLDSFANVPFDLIERGDQGTGVLRVKLDTIHRGIFRVFFGAPLWNAHAGVFATAVLLIGLDVDNMDGSARTLWRAS